MFISHHVVVRHPLTTTSMYCLSVNIAKDNIWTLTQPRMARRTAGIEDLRRLLREEQQLRETEQRRAQKAEEDKQKAEERANTLNTTFEEYLKLCHNHLSKRLSIQTDKSRSTQGTVTSPKNKCYPNKLRQWEGFLEGQKSRFDEIYNYFHPPSEPPGKLFDSSHALEGIGRKICDRNFASEDDLRPHQHLAVESPIADIISALKSSEFARERSQTGHGVMFESHLNTLDRDAEEVQQRLQAQQLSDSDSSGPTSSMTIKADRVCVFKNTSNANTLLFLIEYKPPHKLPVTDLRRGLRHMNLHREVVQQYKRPTDPEDRQQHDADELVGKVITQTFHYMIEGGVQYSYISTGEAFIFLWIKEDNPTKIYYHLVTPNQELGITGNPKIAIFHTAVGQVLSFCLLAFGSERRNSIWRNKWISLLPKWPLSQGAVMSTTPDNKQIQTPDTSDFKGKPEEVKRSYYLRQKPIGRNVCDEDAVIRYSYSDDDSSPEGHLGDSGTPSRPSRAAPAPAPAREASRPDQISSRTRSQSQRYCTQACLLGLARGGVLDKNCPNMLLHRRGRRRVRHRIDIETFMRLVREQLKEDLDEKCERLGKQGARGMLFRITLAWHGYSFVGKGTVSVFVPDLLHEGRVYQTLERLQGEVVPVYLGNIDLIRSYVDVGVELVHMLLMSWGGEVAKKADVPDWDKELGRSVREVSDEGVEHNDVREANILWNVERGRAMLIDFERSSLVASHPLGPLQELSPNRKRKRRPEVGKIRQ